MQDSFTLHCLTWLSGATKIQKARLRACELGLLSPRDLMEESDAGSYHALALDRNGQAIGCARISPKGEAERVVILPGDNHKQIESALIMAAWLHENQTLRYA